MKKSDEEVTPALGTKAMPSAGPILLVEDDPEHREMIADHLRAGGYDVTEASNGREALDLLTSMTPAPFVVVLDLQMPVMDGWQLVAIMRSYHRLLSIPVIAVTATNPPSEARQVFEAFFAKPCDPRALLAAITRIAASGVS